MNCWTSGLECARISYGVPLAMIFPCVGPVPEIGGGSEVDIALHVEDLHAVFENGASLHGA